MPAIIEKGDSRHFLKVLYSLVLPQVFHRILDNKWKLSDNKNQTAVKKNN